MIPLMNSPGNNTTLWLLILTLFFTLFHITPLPPVVAEKTCPMVQSSTSIFRQELVMAI